MKKAIFKGAYNFVIENVPKPTVGPGQMLVRVRYCSVCGSDVHVYKYDMDPGLDALADSWSKSLGFPIQDTIGHQFCGEVVDVGEGVQSAKVGDRIAGQGMGGYAEYILIGDGATLLPESVTWEQASYLEPLNVAINSIKKSRLKLGDTIVVMGAGSIGQLVFQSARAAGAGKVIVLDRLENRLLLAKELGADAVINAGESEIVERVKKLTNGIGPDIVFECTGNPEALETMIEILPMFGQGVIVSTYEKRANLDFNTVALKSLNLQGILGMENYFPIALSLVASGRVRVDQLYSAIMPLEKINEALHALLEGKEVGVIIEP